MAEARASRSVTRVFEHKILGVMWRGHSGPRKDSGLSSVDFLTHTAVTAPAVTRAGAPAPHKHDHHTAVVASVFSFSD